MGTRVRAVTAAMAVSVLAAVLVPNAVARVPPADRMRSFAPTPSLRPAAEGVDVGQGPRIVETAAGRIAWRSGPRPPAVHGPVSAPSQTMGFDAIPRIGGNWPADPTGALGDSVFVTAVNSSYAVYDRAGMVLLGPSPLRALFPLPDGTQVFDPKIVYDGYRDRFVLAFLGVNDRRDRSWILVVAIPDRTATDIGTWCGAQIDGDRTSGDGRQFADYPGLGYDRDHVVVTTNQFDVGTESYRGAQVISTHKGNLYRCDRVLKVRTFAGEQMRNPDGSLAFTVQPATTVGAGNHLYLLSFQDGRLNFLVLWRMKEIHGRLTLQNVALNVPAVSIGPYGTQGGGSMDVANTWWDPGDLRMTNAFADLPNTHVYAAHVVAADLRPDPLTGDYAEAVIRWYEVAVGSALERSEVTRIGTIGAPEADVGWPAIATDGAGNVFVAYSRASQPLGEFLSAWVARIERGRTAGTSLLLAGGSGRMEAVPGPERWGDYAAIARDPADPSVLALFDQYVVDDGDGVTEDWQQTVHLVRDG